MKKRKDAQSVPVNCAYDELVQLVKLVANPRNPNRHPEDQIKLLAKIIAHQGWRAPIVVSKRSGFIVVGHGRLAAAKLLGCDTVPVDYQEFDTESDEWAHLLADNRLAELAETDGAVLKDVLLELDTGDFDMDMSGFVDEEMERVINSFREPTKLVELKLQPPPKMIWTLIGIPTVEYGNIQAAIEAIAKIPAVVCEQTAGNEQD